MALIINYLLERFPWLQGDRQGQACCRFVRMPVLPTKSVFKAPVGSFDTSMFWIDDLGAGKYEISDRRNWRTIDIHDPHSLDWLILALEAAK